MEKITNFKIKVKDNTFLIETTNAYYYTSVKKATESESIFEFNISKARFQKVLIGITTLFGISSVTTMLF